MTTYESYSTRYSKSKQKQHLRSISPIRKSSIQNSKDQLIQQVSINNESSNQLGKIISKLNDRVDGIQIKIISITNIVKMLQKYTQTRDEQYEKQKQNQQFRNSIMNRVDSIQSLEMQNKFKQFELLAQKLRSQMAAMQSLRVGLSRQTHSKNYSFQSPQTINNRQSLQSPSISQTEMMAEIQTIVNEMQSNLREQMNGKIEICINYLKNTVEQTATMSMKSLQPAHFGSPTTVNSMNSTMLQQQLHNLILTVNKIESDCIRNKMVADKKIQELASYITEIRKNMVRLNSRRDRNRSMSLSQSKNNTKNTKSIKSIVDDNKSDRSSRSKRSVSRKTGQQSKSQYNLKNSKITQQKKIKQNQLKQALRKKKQNQEKLLKMKKIER